jgi:hypothetical protein
MTIYRFEVAGMSQIQKKVVDGDTLKMAAIPGLW